jgi:branched-chain amino acid transport system ATP-binding protein
MSTVDGGARAVLEVQGLNAYYGKSQVIFDLDLRVGPGEAVAVLGRNGAGKTTALMAIAGVVTNHAARLRLAGEDISHMPSFRRVRSGLSLVPSGSRAFPNLTVNENLELVKGGNNGGAQWTTGDAYRTFPKLAELKGNSAGTLSGGERQMLVIGRALMSRPRLLLLDEPSLGLAPIVAAQIMRLVRDLRRETGLTVLLVEQNAKAALSVADRGIVLSLGRIVADDDPRSLASDDALRHAYLGF